MLGMVEVPVPVGWATNFQPTIELLEEAARQAGGPLAGLVVVVLLLVITFSIFVDPRT